MTYNPKWPENIVDDGSGVKLNSGVAVNKISDNSSSDSTSALMTTEAIQALAGGGGLFIEDANNNIIGGTNAGSEQSTGVDNFLGGVSAGQFGDGARNIAIGTQALEGTTENTFNDNIGIGHQCGLDITTSGQNILIGNYAGYSLTTAGNNVFIGYEAGYEVIAASNVFIGYQAGRNLDNASNSSNVAIGFQAALGETVGVTSWNIIAVGAYALTAIDGAKDCVAVGASSLRANTSGLYNTALGFETSRYITTGTRNVTVGYKAGKGNSGQNYTDNIIIGAQACESITISSNNVVIGASAGFNLLDGPGNVLIGYRAGLLITTGNYNIIVGYDLDADNITGNYQFMLGNVTYPFLRGDMANYILNINGPDGYLNFGSDATATGDALGTSGYGIRDNNGSMEYKDLGGSWTDFGGSPNPAFSVILSQDQTNINPDTIVTVLFNNKIYDRGNDFDTGTRTFTAPVTGEYHFDVQVYFNDLDTGAANYMVELVTSGRTFKTAIDTQRFTDDLNMLCLSISVDTPMDADHTARVRIYQNGGLQQTDILWDGAGFGSWFTGHLIA